MTTDINSFTKVKLLSVLIFFLVMCCFNLFDFSQNLFLLLRYLDSLYFSRHPGEGGYGFFPLS